MASFTCITEASDSIHISQHSAGGPDYALRDHISALPSDDCDGPFDDELEWLQNVSNGETEVELISVTNCKNTWLWRDGTTRKPQILTYIIKTDIND